MQLSRLCSSVYDFFFFAHCISTELHSFIVKFVCEDHFFSARDVLSEETAHWSSQKPEAGRARSFLFPFYALFLTVTNSSYAQTLTNARIHNCKPNWIHTIYNVNCDRICRKSLPSTSVHFIFSRINLVLFEKKKKTFRSSLELRGSRLDPELLDPVCFPCVHLGFLWVLRFRLNSQKSVGELRSCL